MEIRELKEIGKGRDPMERLKRDSREQLVMMIHCSLCCRLAEQQPRMWPMSVSYLYLASKITPPGFSFQQPQRWCKPPELLIPMNFRPVSFISLTNGTKSILSRRGLRPSEDCQVRNLSNYWSNRPRDAWSPLLRGSIRSLWWDFVTILLKIASPACFWS